MGESIVTLLSPNFSFMDAIVAFQMFRSMASDIFSNAEAFYFKTVIASQNSAGEEVSFYTKTFSFSPTLYFGYLGMGNDPIMIYTASGVGETSHYVYPPKMFNKNDNVTFSYNTYRVSYTFITSGNQLTLSGKVSNNTGSGSTFINQPVSGIMIAIP